MANPLVTIVTPTWDRDDFVFRAILSVALQTYRPVEHIVVSDGPNPALETRLKRLRAYNYSMGEYELRTHFLPQHDTSARWGHHARMRGIELATGNLIAYLDDDEQFLPHHVEGLVRALQDVPGAGFAYSRIKIFDPGYDWVSGEDPPRYGQVSTSTLMHHRSVLDKATWRQGWTHSDTIDWDLVKRWMDAGVKWAYNSQITVLCHRDAPNVSSDRERDLA